jgi:hypothetical protein
MSREAVDMSDVSQGLDGSRPGREAAVVAEAERTVRGFTVAAIATVMALAVIGIVPLQLSSSGAATVAPQWG